MFDWLKKKTKSSDASSNDDDKEEKVIARQQSKEIVHELVRRSSENIEFSKRVSHEIVESVLKSNSREELGKVVDGSAGIVQEQTKSTNDTSNEASNNDTPQKKLITITIPTKEKRDEKAIADSKHHDGLGLLPTPAECEKPAKKVWLSEKEYRAKRKAEKAARIAARKAQAATDENDSQAENDTRADNCDNEHASHKNAKPEKVWLSDAEYKKKKREEKAARKAAAALLAQQEDCHKEKSKEKIKEKSTEKIVERVESGMTPLLSPRKCVAFEKVKELEKMEGKRIPVDESKFQVVRLINHHHIFKMAHVLSVSLVTKVFPKLKV